MAARCQVLCQHPGCWYSGEKKFEPKERSCPGYFQYIDDVLAKRKATDSSNHAKCVSQDGLPFLTVSELTSDLPSSDHTLSNTSHTLPNTSHTLPNNSHTLPPQDRHHGISRPLTAGSMRFSLNTPLYGDRGRSPSPPPQQYEEYWFTPVLVWKPGKTIKKLAEKERREDKLLKTTNLTDSLPVAPVEQTKDKRPVSRVGGRRSRNFKLSMDEYIMEGLKDVPSHLVNQIIQELHNCSDDDITHTNPNTKPLKQPLEPRHSSFPSLPSSWKLRPHNSTVPSSVMLNLQSNRATNGRQNSLRKSRRRSSTVSYSRALASHPQKALSSLKTRVAQLQHDDDHYYMISKPSGSDSQEGCGDMGGGSILRNLPQSVTTGPSHFTPRSLNKATVQRLSYHNPLKHKIHTTKGRLDLLISSRNGIRMGYGGHLLPPVDDTRPSIHIPILPIHDRPFSEDALSTIPPSSAPNAINVCPDSRRSDLNSCSQTSSDRMIISADLASQTGELFLLNKEGEVVHHVTDMVTPGRDANEGEELHVEAGSVAPPPSARDEVPDK